MNSVADAVIVVENRLFASLEGRCQSMRDLLKPLIHMTVVGRYVPREREREREVY
jgi:hypothetical protein